MNCTAFKFIPTTPFVLDKHAQFIPATRIRNPHRNVYSSVGFSFTRKKLKRCRHFAPPNATPLVELELPLLPFPLNEVLVPSESKALHLYEARYLALLEEAEPYLKGVVIPVHDRVPESESGLDPKVMQVKEALYSLNSLEIKLKAPKEAPLQTRIANSLMWSEKELGSDCDEAFIPSLPERVSFAALQPVSGSGESELAKLQLEKLRAMELKDTVQRLDNSLEFVKDNISMVAAKLAIQSVDVERTCPTTAPGYNIPCQQTTTWFRLLCSDVLQHGQQARHLYHICLLHAFV